MTRRIRTKKYNVKERKDEIKQAIKELIKSGVENKNLFGKEYAMIYTDGHVGIYYDGNINEKIYGDKIWEINIYKLQSMFKKDNENFSSGNTKEINKIANKEINVLMKNEKERQEQKRQLYELLTKKSD